MTKPQFKIVFLYAIVAAAVYLVTVFVFLYSQSYTQSWLLYMGNALFASVIGFFLFRYYKFNNYKLKLTQLISAGQTATFAGIVIACIFSLILVIFIVPEAFTHLHVKSAAVERMPDQLRQEKNSYLLVLSMDAIFGNIGAGSFIALLFPFTLYRNQQG